MFSFFLVIAREESHRLRLHHHQHRALPRHLHDAPLRRAGRRSGVHATHGAAARPPKVHLPPVRRLFARHHPLPLQRLPPLPRRFLRSQSPWQRSRPLQHLQCSPWGRWGPCRWLLRPYVATTAGRRATRRICRTLRILRTKKN